AEHHRAEVARRRRGVDGPVVPVLDQHRERPGVVDVRVREDDGIDGAGIDGELPVPLERLAPPALEHAAVEQHAGVLGAEQVHRPRDGARRAEELEVHPASLHYFVGQGVPSAAGAGTVAVPFWRKVEKKHPYWYFTASSCE